MLTITRHYYPAIPGVRAEVVSSVLATCDLCGAQCESSRHYDESSFYQEMAHEQAKLAGYVERVCGRIRQLVCPKCATQASKLAEGKQ